MNADRVQIIDLDEALQMLPSEEHRQITYLISRAIEIESLPVIEA